MRPARNPHDARSAPTGNIMGVTSKSKNNRSASTKAAVTTTSGNHTSASGAGTVVLVARPRPASEAAIVAAGGIGHNHHPARTPSAGGRSTLDCPRSGRPSLRRSKLNWPSGHLVI